MDYPIIYVETVEQLKQLADKLTQLSEFALDLEADVNLHRYGRKLCLASSGGECCWLVDTTSVDISILKPSWKIPK